MYKYITLSWFYYWINEVGNDNEERIHYIFINIKNWYNLIYERRNIMHATEIDSILGVAVIALLIGVLYAVKDILKYISSKTHSAAIKAECAKLEADITNIQEDIKDNESAISNSVDEGVKSFLRTQNKVKQQKVNELILKKSQLENSLIRK